MNWWGKLIGGAFGFMLGGPIGALLGAALGHSLDTGIRQLENDGFASGDQQRVQTVFFTSVFGVMGHLAKADGRVTESEIRAARHVMSQMRLSEEQTRLAMALFNEGKRSDFKLEAVLQQFREECQRRSNLMQMFLEILLVTALADGELHGSEQKLLQKIAENVGFSRYQFEKLLAMAVAQQRYANFDQDSGSYQSPPLEEAYRALGVSSNISDAELKKTYRRLMSQHHPDKLVAKGLPEEMVKLATEKTQEISTAYKQIIAARGG